MKRFVWQLRQALLLPDLVGAPPPPLVQRPWQYARWRHDGNVMAATATYIGRDARYTIKQSQQQMDDDSDDDDDDAKAIDGAPPGINNDALAHETKTTPPQITIDGAAVVGDTLTIND